MENLKIMGAMLLITRIECFEILDMG